MNKTVAIVALNESEYLDDALKEKLGGSLYTLYFYDPEETTNCCEITPSYYLTPFDYYGKERLSDEDDSDYRTDILGDEIYMHCRSVDAIDEKFKTTVEIEMDEDDDFLEQAREYLNGNPAHPAHALSF